jgi:transposase
MSPNTERSFRLLLQPHGVLEGSVDPLPSTATLREFVTQARLNNRPHQHESSVEKWLTPITKLFDDGARPKAIFDWLKLHEEGFDGSLSAVKRCVHQLRRTQGVREEDVVIRVDTPPGLVAQVDFGDVGKFLCPKTKLMQKAYVFVMVLGYSRHMFAQIVFDQTVATWLALHAAAFAFFGGVVATIVPDNLKSAVLRAAFDVRSEAALNLSYRDLARHYEFNIDPTPPYSPEKKGKVESSVKYVKSNFIATLDERSDIERVNAQLEQWVLKIAGERHHGTTHEAPLGRFTRVEKFSLKPLPEKPWTHVNWRQVQVRRDSHILLEGAAYSVPWRLIGRSVVVRRIGSSIEIYWEDTRVATHECTAKGTTQTNDAHLPTTRRDYRHRDPAYWRERAAALHSDVAAYIDEVIASDTVQNQVTKVAAMIRLFEEAGADRAGTTCRRASYYGNFTYSAVKKILQERLDLQPLPIALVCDPQDLRAPKFARSLAHYFESSEVTSDAPN